MNASQLLGRRRTSVQWAVDGGRLWTGGGWWVAVGWDISFSQTAGSDFPALFADR